MSKPLEVNILAFDDYINMYVVEYVLFVRSGVSRRSKAFYHKGELSRDSENTDLVDRVRSEIKTYNKLHNIKV